MRRWPLPLARGTPPMPVHLHRQRLQRQLHRTRVAVKHGSPLVGFHVIIGVLVCLLIPGWSWLDGSGWLAWTMFAHSATYRLRVTGLDSRGPARVIAPTQLSARADRKLGTFLAGADSWRHAPVGA